MILRVKRQFKKYVYTKIFFDVENCNTKFFVKTSIQTSIFKSRLLYNDTTPLLLPICTNWHQSGLQQKIYKKNAILWNDQQPPSFFINCTCQEQKVCLIKFLVIVAKLSDIAIHFCRL